MKNYNDYQAFLAKQGENGRLSQNLRSAVGTGALVLQETALEIRKEIEIGGTIQLLESSDPKRTGENGFDYDKLNDYKNMIVTGIRLGYDHDAASGKQSDLGYAQIFPPALRNAHLVITQGNKELLRLPATVFNTTGTLTGSKVQEYFKELSIFTFLEEADPIEVKIEFPKGAAIAGTDKHYVEVILQGVITSRR